MFNANEARKMTNEFKANEIAKMNEYARLHAEHLGEEIEVAAAKGEDHITTSIKDDLMNPDLRAKVLAILKNNGYYVKSDYFCKNIFIAW